MRLLSVLVFCLLALPVRATTPRLLSQQGRLLDSNDQPVDGTLQMRFAIYERDTPPTNGNETPLWSQTKQVTFTNGLYAALIGDDESNPLPLSVFNGPPRYLAITVADGPELEPRLEIVTPVYADSARDSATVGGFAPDHFWSKDEAVDAATLGSKAPTDYWQKSDAVDAATLGTKAPSDYWQKSDAVDAATLGSKAPGAFWQKSEAVDAATLGTKAPSDYWQKTDAVDAATLGSKAPSDYWQKSEAVDAATLGSKAASAYWQKTEAVNAATFAGQGLSSFARTDLASTLAAGLFLGAPSPLQTCDSSKKGLLLRDPTSGGLMTCDGTQWIAITKIPGLTRATAMSSCAALRDAGAVMSGVYWINPKGTPMRVWCEQELEGGGWAMVYNSVASGSTADFWNIPYAERLMTKGAPDVSQNSYNGAIFPLGRTFMDVVEGLDGKEVVGFVATTTGINTTTMRFANPALVKGNGDMYTCHFAAGWSAPDYDGDDSPGNNCATEYGNVTQFYCSCWNTNLGYDADSSPGGNQYDNGWGPHSSDAGALGLSTDGSQYSRVQRITRFAKW